MSFNFELPNYSIITSLNERNIYIKCVDQTQFTNYETNLDQKEVRLQFDLVDIYNIINNCLRCENGYSVNFNVSSGTLKLIFNALVGGFLKINFEALLREKILSNDGQLTIKFNIMEQKYEALSRKFDKFIEKYEETQEENIKLMNAISNAEIILTPHTFGSHNVFSGHIYKINSTSIVIDFYPQRTCNGGYVQFIEPSFDRVREFYQLEKLELNYYKNINFTVMKNYTLKELKIQCHGEPNFKSVDGINGFPNLEKLEIYQAHGLNDIVGILKGYKHKINTIILVGCKSVNVVEIQTYCQVNNIHLNIS